MANFNGPEQDQTTPNYTGASQGVYSSNAGAGLEDLGRGLAAAINGGVQGVDEQIQQNITEDIGQQFDQINAEFGVDSATELQQDFDASGPQRGGAGIRGARPVPQAINDAGDNLQSLQEAYQNGSIKESYYYARLNSMVRQIRGKYPGYRDIIDQKVAQVTGMRPANELRQSLFNEWGKQDPATKQMSDLVDWSVKNGNLPVDYYDRMNSGKPYSFTELQAHVAGQERDKADLASKQANLSLSLQQGTLDQKTALVNFKGEVTSAVQKALGDAQSVAGGTYAQLMAKVKSAQDTITKGGTVSAEDQTALRQGVTDLKYQLRALAGVIGTTPWNGDTDPTHTYQAQITSSDDYNKAIDDALLPLDLVEKALDDPTYGMLGSTAAWLKASTDANTKDIFQKIPITQTLAALSAAWGPQLAGLYFSLNPATTEAAQKSLSDYFNAKSQLDVPPGAPAPSFSTDLKSANEQGYGSIADQKIADWKNKVDALAQGKLPENVMGKEVDYLFGPQNLNIFSQMDPTSKINYWSQLSAPAVTKQMLALRDAGDTARWEEYKQWTLNGFQALARQQFADLSEYNLDKNQLQVSFNPQTQQFILVANPNYHNPALDKLNGVDPSVLANAQQDRQTQVRAQIDRLNIMLNTIKPIVEAEDQQVSSVVGELFKQFPRTTTAKNTIADDVLNALPPDPGNIPGQTEKDDGRPKPGEFWDQNLPFQPQFVPPVNEQGNTTGATLPAAPISFTPDAPDQFWNAIPDLSSRAQYNNGSLGEVKGLVFHHTGGRGTAEGVVDTLNQRGLGTQFVIDRSGKVIRTLPEGARGAQIRPAQNGSGLSNANSIGVEVIANDDKDILPVQVAAAEQLAKALEAKYGFSQDMIFGHGELNRHKQETEGHTIVSAIRSGKIQVADLTPSELIHVTAPTAFAQLPVTNKLDLLELISRRDE